MIGSGFGDVTGSAEAVAWELGLGYMSSSGCELADFAGFTMGNIAIIQRGACTFGLKAENAVAAGAIAAIIFAQGDALDRFDIVPNPSLGFTFSPDNPAPIPVFHATYAPGTSLDVRRC